MFGTSSLTSRRHSRRRFLQVAGAAGFTVTATARGGYAVAQTPTAIDGFTQAPSLDGQDLPPVAERVSQHPLVIPPVEEIGQYGGTWRTALVGAQDFPWLDRTVGYEYLIQWSPDWSEMIPNVAESFESSDDARSFTLRLRAGMRWSDGEPFTTADIDFYVNHVYRNEELSTTLGDNPFTVEIHDEVEFTIVYERPNGFALQDLCTWRGADWVQHPRHYLEQFHIEFNPDGIDALIEENGADDWVELFNMKGGSISGTSYNAINSNVDLPRLNGWRLVEPYGEGQRVRYERNPWYWKVDPEGQQLPYIDEVVFDVLEDAEVLLLRASNGELDFHSRHINTVINKPVLAENRESGGYEFVDLLPSSMNTAAIALNLTHKSEALREIFQNKDFRVGLSHAINRQEIIDVIFVSQGEPWQLSPRTETPWHNEELAKQFTEYDVDLANKHLDKVLPDKNGDGMRLLPNGEPLTFQVMATPDYMPEHVDIVNLVTDYWKAVGVGAELNSVARSLLYSRKEANEHDAVVWIGDSGLQDAILEPRWYFPSTGESNFGYAWYLWYQNPPNPQAEPMEPPEEAQRQMELYDEVEATADPEVQNQVFNELLEISVDMFYAIGISLPSPGYAIKNVSLRNVPSVMPDASLYPNPAPTNPQQWWFDDKG